MLLAGEPEPRARGGEPKPRAVRISFRRGRSDKERTIKAAWLKEMVSGAEGDVPVAVEINSVIIEDDLNFSNTTFGCSFSITESEFRGEVSFSFSVFRRGLNLLGSSFLKKVDFRAAHAGGDFHIPLTRFDDYACFDDIYADEVFSAEGASFGRTDFNRALFSKSAFFCCALSESGEATRTQFRGEANFNDAHFKGPTYFSGASFRDMAVFNRACIDSSAFFNCDTLEEGNNPSQPRHKRHRRFGGEEAAPRRTTNAPGRVLATTFGGSASFIGARISNSITFSGARFEKGADFRRIKIEGTAIFEPFARAGEDIFLPVRFGGAADFRNASIKGGAEFASARFVGGANFERMHVGGAAMFHSSTHRGQIIPAYFGKSTTFADAHIDGSVRFEGAYFERGAKFERVHVGGYALFGAYEDRERTQPPFSLTRTYFGGRADFLDAYFKGSVVFDGAMFNDEATFERLRADGTIFFRAAKLDFDERADPYAVMKKRVLIPVRFLARANFLSAAVRGNAEFDGAQFHREAVFERMEVGGDIYLRPWDVNQEPEKYDDDPVRFYDKAVFIGATIKGNAEFSGTQFERDADFTGLQFLSSTYFDSQHHYVEDGGDYNDPDRRLKLPVTFNRDVYFIGASFLNQTEFRAAEFRSEADFTGVRGTGKVDFSGANFRGHCTFREARFTTLDFGRRPDEFDDGAATNNAAAPDTEAKFTGSIDMRGCAYEHIEVKLKHLLDSLERQREDGKPTPPYDRHPYSHLVKTLRAVGDEHRADVVYLRQRDRERNGLKQRFLKDYAARMYGRSCFGLGNYLIDCLFWMVSKYGVQPLRLLGISIIIMLVGMHIFSLPKAVKLKDTDGLPPSATVDRSSENWVVKVNQPPDKGKGLSYFDASKISISQFIPIVDLPAGSKWKPTDQEFVFLYIRIATDSYASVHRLLGAILVPLLLAALAASLYRRFKADL
ncbi:MAG TPA: pentapeptide repeat-containing protein [Pyrinomonadaceae bacterium]|nr:pentapeptide repeat-containing protein [Pyrinomonadaceae bacterium]